MPYIKSSQLELQATIEKDVAIKLLEKGSGKTIEKIHFDKYWNIVQSKEKLFFGFEDHHIIPRAYMNILITDIEINSIENLCRLSYRNHFLAHYYLWKAVRDGKTAMSIKLMYLFRRSVRGISDECLAADEYSQLKRDCWADPRDREKHSNTLKKYYRENPIALSHLRQRMADYFSKEENRKKQSFVTSKYFKDHPEAAIAHGAMMKKRFKENPALGKLHGQKLNKYYEDFDKRRIVSEKLKKFNQENPEFRKGNSERIKVKWKDPKYRLTLSLAKCKPLICVNTGVEFVSSYEAESVLKTNRHKLLKQARGSRKTAWNGYMFRFANELESQQIKEKFFRKQEALWVE